MLILQRPENNVQIFIYQRRFVLALLFWVRFSTRTQIFFMKGFELFKN